MVRQCTEKMKRWPFTSYLEVEFRVATLGPSTPVAGVVGRKLAIGDAGLVTEALTTWLSIHGTVSLGLCAAFREAVPEK